MTKDWNVAKAKLEKVNLEVNVASENAGKLEFVDGRPVDMTAFDHLRLRLMQTYMNLLDVLNTIPDFSAAQ